MTVTNDLAIQRLSDAVVVATGKEHSFGTDAFLLAYFAGVRKKELVCDLGTGCGIIPLIFAKNGAEGEIYGVDIQEKAIMQFEHGIALSQAKATLHPILADLKALDGLPFGMFDVVTCNPPYKAEKSGIESQNEAERIARHEVCCNQADVCKAAARLLRYGGRLCICQRPERLADVVCAMRESGIEPKRLRMVCRKKGETPWLFLIEGKKGGKPHLVVEKEFAVYDGAELSQEAKALYGDCFSGRGG